MCLPEGEKGLLAGAVRTGDAVQVDLDIACAGAALRDGTGQMVRPFPDKLSLYDNLGSISQMQDRGSQHDHARGTFRAKHRRRVIP
jgi:hypothetical protein